MAEITVDRNACERCGACVDVCAIARVFEMTEESSVALHPEACWNCGQCVAVCPHDAIDHDAYPLEECPIVEPGGVPHRDALIAAYRMRRSQRAFRDNVVDREIIRELVTLGRWAPTAMNNQSVDWLAFDDPARIEELSSLALSEMSRLVRRARNPLVRWMLPLVLGRAKSRMLREASAAVELMESSRARGEDPVFYHAPVVLIGHCPSGSPFARDDAIYAAYNIMLAAETFDLGTCQIGEFQLIAEHSGRLLRRIGIPKGRKPQVVLIVGYPSRTFRRSLPRRSPNLIWNTR